MNFTFLKFNMNSFKDKRELKQNENDVSDSSTDENSERKIISRKKKPNKRNKKKENEVEEIENDKLVVNTQSQRVSINPITNEKVKSQDKVLTNQTSSSVKSSQKNTNDSVEPKNSTKQLESPSLNEEMLYNISDRCDTMDESLTELKSDSKFVSLICNNFYTIY